MPTIIHWFRRDLRLRDNPALLAALRASGGRIVPLFILDDMILRDPDTSAARVTFLLASLRELAQALRARGSRLIVRRGSPGEVLADLADRSQASGVYFNRDYTPFATARDAAARAALEARGVETRSFKEAMIVEPDEIYSKAGTPYVVYTPYSRKWRACAAEYALCPPEPLLEFAPVPDEIASLPLPTAAELGAHTEQQLPPGGEQAGFQRLEAWSQHTGGLGIGRYASGRDRPAQLATSRLSPYLRFGCVAPLACLRAAQAAADRATNDEQARGASTWIGELAWRDFYYQVLAHFPHVHEGAFKPIYNTIAWQNDQQLFEAWCAGRTGYPIVDAAMRQLNHQAWMHNRARMIVASFLAKDLLIDWRWGERYFMRQLVDGDQASNNGGWQWAAGTGTDAQPYFRIFNATRQGEKFDPQALYIKQYLPELARVPLRYIHAPWSMPPAEQQRAGCVIGRDYPAPVVDHAVQRERALELYRNARSQQKAESGL